MNSALFFVEIGQKTSIIFTKSLKKSKILYKFEAMVYN